MPMRGWNNNRAQYEQARVEAIRRYWASKRSEQRRKRQSEWAKTLNNTMPKAMRAANGKKISKQAKERLKDPVKQAEFKEYQRRGRITQEKNAAAHKRMTAGLIKRRKDLDRARDIVGEWGLYVEENATQEQIDEIIAIFI